MFYIDYIVSTFNEYLKDTYVYIYNNFDFVWYNINNFCKCKNIKENSQDQWT